MRSFPIPHSRTEKLSKTNSSRDSTLLPADQSNRIKEEQLRKEEEKLREVELKVQVSWDSSSLVLLAVRFLVADRPLSSIFYPYQREIQERRQELVSLSSSFIRNSLSFLSTRADFSFLSPPFPTPSWSRKKPFETSNLVSPLKDFSSRRATKPTASPRPFFFPLFPYPRLLYARSFPSFHSFSFTLLPYVCFSFSG